MNYLHLVPNALLPDDLTGIPFKAIVVIEDDVDPEWRRLVSEWLVRSGCLYMMAWGKDCSSWDDSVDLANLEAFHDGGIPDDKFVVTTWHESESLSEVFCFSKNGAHHGVVRLEESMLIHISHVERQLEILQDYENA